MSTGLTAVQRIEFDSMVKAAYQANGKLRKHVRNRTGVRAATCRFRRSGRGVATPRIPQTNVVPMNTGFFEATATLSDWNAAEYTDVFDQAKTDVDERRVVAENIAAATGRREDQLIIDALNAANGSANIAAGGTGLTFDKIRRAKALMDARAVPEGKRKMAISARGAEDLLGENRFISRDFVESYVIRTGRLPPILGFEIEIIEDRDEGGLPLVTTTRTNFAWDADAIGLAIGIDHATSVDWIAEKTSWLSNRIFSAGSVAIDALGVLEIDTVEA
jgi:hypothetical protein